MSDMGRELFYFHNGGKSGLGLFKDEPLLNASVGEEGFLLLPNSKDANLDDVGKKKYCDQLEERAPRGCRGAALAHNITTGSMVLMRTFAKGGRKCCLVEVIGKVETKSLDPSNPEWELIGWEEHDWGGWQWAQFVRVRVVISAELLNERWSELIPHSPRGMVCAREAFPEWLAEKAKLAAVSAMDE